jgi:hypothetical protein
MRIRSAHPGLLTDEAFMTLTVESPLAVALIIGLWMESDDAGTFEWKPLTIKARVLPAVSDSVVDLLATLVRLDFIKKFELADKSYGVVRNFVKFQRPKKPKEVHPFCDAMRLYAGFNADGKRPNAGTGRPSDDDGSEPVSNSAETTSELQPRREEEGGKMKEEVKSKADALLGAGAPQSQIDIEDLFRSAVADAVPIAPAAKLSRAKARSQISETAQPTPADVKAGIAAGIDPPAFRVQWNKFRDYHRAKGSVMADWSAAWLTWLADLATPSAVQKLASKAPRAARLREDWEPSAANFAYAESIGLTGNQIAEIAFEFKNYWLGEGGARACKADWNRTFTNRLLEQSKRVGGRNARAGPNWPAKPSALSVLQDISNGTREPQSDDSEFFGSAAGDGLIIEGCANDVPQCGGADGFRAV